MNVREAILRAGIPAFARLLWLMGTSRVLDRQLLRIRSIDCAPKSECGVLYEHAAPVCETFRGAHDLATAPEEAAPFPIRWHRMRNVCIDAHSSFVVDDSHAYLQSGLAALVASRGDFSGGFCWHSGPTACVWHGTSERLERGIAVCGCGAFNWYHWLVEVLPRAMFAGMLPPQFTDWPLIVPPEAATVPQFAESLSRASRDRPIHFLTRGPVRVNDLVWIDSPAVSPFNLTKGWPKPAHCFHHPEAVSALSQTIATCSRRRRTDVPQRVLLVRSNTRRNHNQQDVANMAQSMGFKPVCPDLLGLDEQVALFQNAEFIIGPSGAAWTGLLFARRGARGVIWMAEQYRGFNAFANLAAMTGFDLRHVYHRLEARTTAEAYSATYRIDVAALHMTLVGLVRA